MTKNTKQRKVKMWAALENDEIVLIQKQPRLLCDYYLGMDEKTHKRGKTTLVPVTITYSLTSPKKKS